MLPNWPYYAQKRQLSKFTEEQKQKQLLALGLCSSIPEQLVQASMVT